MGDKLTLEGNKMDIVIVLGRLGYFEGEEQSPSPDMSTYQIMVDNWRHTTKSPPTEAVMLAEWDVYLDERASTQYLRDREAAIREQLPEMMRAEAELKQAITNRANGITLHPDMADMVEIYEKIMEKYEDPIETQGDEG